MKQLPRRWSNLFRNENDFSSFFLTHSFDRRIKTDDQGRRNEHDEMMSVEKIKINGKKAEKRIEDEWNKKRNQKIYKD